MENAPVTLNPELQDPPQWAKDILGLSHDPVAVLPTTGCSDGRLLTLVFFMVNISGEGRLFGTIATPSVEKGSLDDAASTVRSLLTKYVSTRATAVRQGPTVNPAEIERVQPEVPPPIEVPASESVPPPAGISAKPKRGRRAAAPTDSPAISSGDPEVPPPPAVPQPPPKIFVPDGMDLRKVADDPATLATVAPPRVIEPIPHVPVPANLNDPAVPRTGEDHGKTVICYGNASGKTLDQVSDQKVRWYAEQMLKTIRLNDRRNPSAEEVNLANRAAMFLTQKGL